MRVQTTDISLSQLWRLEVRRRHRQIQRLVRSGKWPCCLVSQGPPRAALSLAAHTDSVFHLEHTLSVQTPPSGLSFNALLSRQVQTGSLGIPSSAHFLPRPFWVVHKRMKRMDSLVDLSSGLRRASVLFFVGPPVRSMALRIWFSL